jgi:hypothetical protein
MPFPTQLELKIAMIGYLKNRPENRATAQEVYDALATQFQLTSHERTRPYSDTAPRNYWENQCQKARHTLKKDGYLTGGRDEDHGLWILTNAGVTCDTSNLQRRSHRRGMASINGHPIWALVYKSNTPPELISRCVERNCIAMGSLVGVDLRKYSRVDEIKAELKRREEADSSGSLHRFAESAKPGDLVLVVNTQKTVLGLCEITGDYLPAGPNDPAPQENFTHLRHAKWLARPNTRIPVRLVAKRFYVLRDEAWHAISAALRTSSPEVRAMIDTLDHPDTNAPTDRLSAFVNKFRTNRALSQ